MGTLSVETLNKLDRAGFVAALGSVFERSAWIAERAWARRPFRSRDDLHRELCTVVEEASQEEKVALIRAHPDLVGRAALTGGLTVESAREQSSAGLDRLTPEEVVRFTDLNRRYREKFGFPFVICARENKKRSILEGFTARLSNSREVEIGIALEQIARIARLRLADLVVLD